MEIDIYGMILHICGFLKKKRKQMKKQNKTEQISDYQRGRGLGEGEIREGSQMYGDG